MHVNPAELGITERYKLLVGGVVPRPIAWVSTLSREGNANLAPFSFTCGVGSDPMTLLYCPANNADGSEKDSLIYADPGAGTGEFVLNIVNETHARAMAATAEPLPRGESEWELAGLEQAPSVNVRPARVAGAPVAYECVTDRVIRLNPGAPSGGNIVLGRVVGVHADDAIIDERYRIDPAKLAAVGRMAGMTYCTTAERFDLPWGKDALEEQS